MLAPVASPGTVVPFVPVLFPGVVGIEPAVPGAPVSGTVPGAGVVPVVAGRLGVAGVPEDPGMLPGVPGVPGIPGAPGTAPGVVWVGAPGVPVVWALPRMATVQSVVTAAKRCNFMGPLSH